MKQITVTEYAKIRKVTRQAVLKQIKLNRTLPGILKYKKIGNNYILHFTTI